MKVRQWSGWSLKKIGKLILGYGQEAVILLLEEYLTRQKAIAAEPTTHPNKKPVDFSRAFLMRHFLKFFSPQDFLNGWHHQYIKSLLENSSSYRFASGCRFKWIQSLDLNMTLAVERCLNYNYQFILIAAGGLTHRVLDFFQVRAQVVCKLISLFAGVMIIKTEINYPESHRVASFKTQYICHPDNCQALVLAFACAICKCCPLSYLTPMFHGGLSGV